MYISPTSVLPGQVAPIIPNKPRVTMELSVSRRQNWTIRDSSKEYTKVDLRPDLSAIFGTNRSENKIPATIATPKYLAY
jgi:hypothetical protein